MLRSSREAAKNIMPTVESRTQKLPGGRQKHHAHRREQDESIILSLMFYPLSGEVYGGGYGQER